MEGKKSTCSVAKPSKRAFRGARAKDSRVTGLMMMKKLLSKMTLKKKLLFISFSSASLALLSVFLSLFFFELHDQKKQLQEALAFRGRMLKSLPFGDPKEGNPGAALKILELFEGDPNIGYVGIFGTDGSPVASSGRRMLPPGRIESAILTLFGVDSGALNLIIPLEGAPGKDVGYVELEGSFGQFYEKFFRMGIFYLAASFLAFLVSSSIIMRSDRFIAGPMQRLLGSMQDIFNKKNYAIRVPAEADDEIGRLARSFNSILAQIENELLKRQKAQENLDFLAHHDALTNLPNRALFYSHLLQAIRRAERHYTKVVLLFLDLDGFKMINDTLGHDAGDELLQIISKRIQASVREEDTVSRIGGDEFTVILEGLKNPADSLAVVEKIIISVSEGMELKDQQVYVTASVGISLFPDDGVDLETLIKNADAAMYAAKEGGKNTYRFFTKDLNKKISKRLQLESNLRRAVAMRELHIYYQPKVDIKTGKISSLEALARWKNDSLGGWVAPMDFIPIAEETGLITTLGRWVLEQACRQVKIWQEAGHKDLSVAVNISSRQLREQNFVDMIKEVIEETKIDPGSLELEITESVLMNNVKKTIEKIKKLKEIGVKFSIDDFGTGYSSMSYLKQLPIDYIKIDKSFVDDIIARPQDAIIINAIIAMAHSLNLKVIAEGVETAGQLRFLKELGCDYIQGYFLHPPLPGAEIYKLLDIGF